MPNFDAGTYFLTILVPVKTETIKRDPNEGANDWDTRYLQAIAGAENQGVAGYQPKAISEVSWAQRLRAVLATLPTALQSPATIDIDVMSPFARNTRNHLSRLVLIENAIFNGRSAANPLMDILRRFRVFQTLFGPYEPPLVPQHIDKLKTPYLLFATEFDAVSQDGAALPAEISADEQDKVRDSYLKKLWDTAPVEMQAVFENCVGFNAVTDAESFVRYMSNHQVETTMPFHDYWIEPPSIKSLPLLPLSVLSLFPPIAFVIATGCWLFGVERLFFLGWSPGIVALGALLLTAVALTIAYKWVMWNGNKPFPPPKHGDLPSVLKALYLQQKFADFVIENQGVPPEDLHSAFRDFIDKHNPQDKNRPTQRPGYISSSESGAVQP